MPIFMVSIFSNNSRTGFKITGKNSRAGISIAYDFTEQVKFILKARLLRKTSDLVHIKGGQVCTL